MIAHVIRYKAADECEKCNKAYGPFTKYMVVEGELRGSRANCHLMGGKAKSPMSKTFIYYNI